MSQDTGFRFLSARNLQTNLGKIDATVECTELAVREFIFNCGTVVLIVIPIA